MQDKGLKLVRIRFVWDVKGNIKEREKRSCANTCDSGCEGVIEY